MKCGLFAALALGIASSALATEVTINNPARQSTDGATSSSTKWVAMAVSPNGRAFTTDALYNSEEAARAAAVSECEGKTARTCPRANTKSVPADWDIVALMCGSAIFMAASAPDVRRADEYAYSNAAAAGYPRSSCGQVANY